MSFHITDLSAHGLIVMSLVVCRYCVVFSVNWDYSQTCDITINPYLLEQITLYYQQKYRCWLSICKNLVCKSADIRMCQCFCFQFFVVGERKCPVGVTSSKSMKKAKIIHIVLLNHGDFIEFIEFVVFLNITL